ncbi:hypothetical protein CSA56_14130 [candidate division KSB3 bacterium]|uniref:Phage P1-related protein n=1 Tax=candidate division KSB3 bacterium TaxID=2044937 RepID=A0A2G6KAZ3_9BACT|nr:MAG: hypothetical protein CSA56_14130 [candidate division KSB3 bacterium]
MSDFSEVLPDILDLSGISWKEILERLYAVFQEDFKRQHARHDGIQVLYDSRILPDGQGKEEGFWHVISTTDRETKERLIDYRRAERLPWAKSMMEQHNIPQFRVFDYDTGRKDQGIRRYICLADYSYVLILKRKKRRFFWITAYYIEKQWRRDKVAKRYNNRVRE